MMSLDWLVGTDPGGDLPPYASDLGTKHMLSGFGLIQTARAIIGLPFPSGSLSHRVEDVLVSDS